VSLGERVAFPCLSRVIRSIFTRIFLRNAFSSSKRAKRYYPCHLLYWFNQALVKCSAYFQFESLNILNANNSGENIGVVMIRSKEIGFVCCHPNKAVNLGWGI